MMDIADFINSSVNYNIVKNELFYGMCQCCLSEENLKNMLQAFMHDGSIEIYTDMLSKCFSIEVQDYDVNVESLYLICESCIEKLRFCFSFRLQVEKTQSYFKSSSLSDSTSKGIIKLEYLNEEKSEQTDIEEKIEHSDYEKKVHKMKSPKFNHQNLKHGIKSSHLSKIVRIKTRKKKLKIVRRDISKKILKMYSKDKINSMTKDEYHKLYNKMYHSELKPFNFDKSTVTCNICQETFQFHKALLDHMRIHYPNFVCDVCGKSFVTKRYLEKHIKRHDDERIQCIVCKKLLKKSTLAEHIKRHKGAKTRHKCSICNEYFNDFYQRQNHLEKVHGINKPKYECTLCFKSFGYSSALSRHVRSYHDEERSFTCVECGRKFFCRKSLEVHSLVHSKERNFQCVICFKRYGRKTTLTHHMKIHNDIKQHICSICGRAFTQKYTLISHLKVHEKSNADCDQIIIKLNDV